MRIFGDSFELMSEMGRELRSYGITVKPKHYQNKDIEGNEDYITKEIIAQSYCLVDMGDPVWLFTFSHSYDWAKAEFNERINRNFINPGEAWKERRDLWEQFLVDRGNDHGVFDYTYNERFNDLASYNGGWNNYIDNVIQLLKDDPDTRKAILSVWDTTIDKDYLDGSRRIPCSMYYHFLVRENIGGGKVLHMIYNQRSSNYIQHFGNDVYLAWRLKNYVAKEIGVTPGYLYHNIDSLHAYKKDWNELSRDLSELVDKY